MICTFAIAFVRAGAQVVPGEGSQIGSIAADRERVRQITGRPLDSTTTPAATSSWQPISPTLRVVWNSQLPTEGGDASLWAGRGANALLSGGASYTRHVGDRLLVLRLEPELTYSQNRAFAIIPGSQAGRSAFNSPWHTGQLSADLPLRFGDLPIRSIGLGQSSLTLTVDRVAVGASASNEWWGPAIRNTLLLSNHAAGIPRLFVRTARPLHTRFGDFEGRAFVGALTESPYFDFDPSNDTRALSGLLVTFRPSPDTGLTLGLARLVTTRLQSHASLPLHVLDVVTRFEPISRPTDPTSTDSSTQGSDQLFSLFARWVFPASGFETYGEWARMELPRSLRALFVAPQNTGGYTLGVQWADPQPRAGRLRVQGEVSYLEQTQSVPGQLSPDFYTGRAVVQGFTQRGQIIGASIGPGSSTQFLAADWLAQRWQFGAFAGRTRTENDAMYRQIGARATMHDVTIFSGVRGSGRLSWADVSGELTVGRRYNYLFQNEFYLGSPIVATDVQNVTLAIVMSPR